MQRAPPSLRCRNDTPASARRRGNRRRDRRRPRRGEMPRRGCGTGCRTRPPPSSWPRRALRVRRVVAERIRAAEPGHATIHEVGPGPTLRPSGEAGTAGRLTRGHRPRSRRRGLIFHAIQPAAAILRRCGARVSATSSERARGNRMPSRTACARAMRARSGDCRARVGCAPRGGPMPGVIRCRERMRLRNSHLGRRRASGVLPNRPTF